MKKWNFLILGIILTLFSIVFLSCKKEEIDYRVDYRDAYLGNWKFNVDRTELNTDSIGYYFQDTIYYEGKIIYGELANQILIKYTNEDSITLTIGDGGELSDFPTHYCGGEFASLDSLRLYLRWGGLGGGITHRIKGLKK